MISLLFMTENTQFHSFIIITMILIATHDSAIRCEDPLLLRTPDNEAKTFRDDRPARTFTSDRPACLRARILGKRPDRVDDAPYDEPVAGVNDRGTEDGRRDGIGAVAKHRRAPHRRRELGHRHALRPPRARIAALYAFIASDRLTLIARYTLIAIAIASMACPVWLSVVLVTEIKSG